VAPLSSPSLSVCRAAEVAPASPFLVTNEGTWTLSDVAHAAQRVAVGLRAQVGDGSSPVAIVADGRPATLVTILSLIDAHVPFVPLHPRLTAAERAVLIAESGATCTLEEEQVAQWMRAPLPPASNEGGVEPRDDLAVVFTSGSAGTPKGAVLPRSAFVASARATWSHLGRSPDDRWLLCMPASHVGGLSILVRCLYRGCSVHVHGGFDADAVVLAAAKGQATLLSVVPTMLADLLLADRHNALAGLRAVLVGGAHASPELLEECHRRGVPALATYGLTETASQIACQDPRGPREKTGVGRPLLGVELTIRDGHILVRGPMLTRGYVGGAPFEPGAWFDTGDLGSVDDAGVVHVSGRRSDRIVSGGENVSPLEVERALEACPGIRRAVVVGVPDARWGQAVAAAIEPVTGQVPTRQALLAELRTTLAPFKLPKRFVVLRELPLLPSRKVDRRTVETLVLDPSSAELR
jgi:O-succinylbenzoic acid--CoA ligase